MRRHIAAAVTVSALALAGCASATNTSAPDSTATQPPQLQLWDGDAAPQAQRIVVLSDIHLGVDDTFGETVENKALLTDFLQRSAASDIDEMVIAGDFLDEWFLPASYPSHADSKAFYPQVKNNNAEVFAAFQEVMANGTTLTYVPGNHDMTLDEATLEELLPGIRQARDVAGLGVRRTGARSEIVIEHGHRYDAGAAPDPLSNQGITGSHTSILPVGYFVTRMIVTSLAQGKSAPVKDRPDIPAPTSRAAAGDYANYQFWSQLMSKYPIQEGMRDAIFGAEFDGYPEPVSLGDVAPALQADGSIGAPMYGDLPQQWRAIQAVNGVAQKNPFAASISAAWNHDFLDKQASTQYFQSQPKTDVVVFGHSHVPLVGRFPQKYQRPKTYANSGTWIDDNVLGPTGTFVAIESGMQATDVRVLQYQADGSVQAVANPQ